MEARFCQYCGSKLEDNGRCPQCPPPEEPAVQVEVLEGQTAQQSPPTYDVPQAIVTYEAVMSAPAQPAKKKHTARNVILTLLCILAAAAIAVYFLCFNPNDREHFEAAEAAWDAGQWSKAQKEYEQISSTCYLRSYVDTRLDILRANAAYIQMAESTWGRSSTGNWMATWWDGSRGGYIWFYGIYDTKIVGTKWDSSKGSSRQEWSGEGTCSTSCILSDNGDLQLKVSVSIPFFTQYSDNGDYVKQGWVSDTFVFQKSDFNKEIILYSKSGYKVTAVVTTSTIQVTYEGSVRTYSGAQAKSATHIIFVRR